MAKRDGQTSILVWFKNEFLAEIEARLAGLGYSDRSKFIREAVYEKLGLPQTGSLRELPMAPSRSGKGGQPTHYKVKRRTKGSSQKDRKKI